jgi:homoserine O-succinyltransferase
MPDPAFSETESQFIRLLGGQPGITVTIHKYWLPGVPRGPQVSKVLEESYQHISHLSARRFDALVITGTEPRASQLQDEPYWGPLRDLIRWAEGNVSSAVLSCLAAHAAILMFDGIARIPLAEKFDGVFSNRPSTTHPLARGMGAEALMPHSRFNDIPTTVLERRGYEPVLSQQDCWSAMALQRGGCLFVLYQGHPEYERLSLLREYRRDIRRYLAGERTKYPSIPKRYFTPAGEAQLREFQRRVHQRPIQPESLKWFPYEELAKSIGASWSTTADRLYANWMVDLLRRKAALVPAEPDRATAVPA